MVPRTGFQIQNSTTSRVAIRDALGCDGLAFRWAQPDPTTWALTLTSGGVATPCAAMQVDVGPHERYYGLGVLELGHELILRTTPRLIEARWFSPLVPYRDWLLNPDAGPNPPARAWDDPAT